MERSSVKTFSFISPLQTKTLIRDFFLTTMYNNYPIKPLIRPLLWLLYTHIHTQTCTHIYTTSRTTIPRLMDICVYIQTHICMYTYMDMCVYVCINSHTYFLLISVMTYPVFDICRQIKKVVIEVCINESSSKERTTIKSFYNFRKSLELNILLMLRKSLLFQFRLNVGGRK